MTIQPQPEQEHCIEETLRTGAYRSPDDVNDRPLASAAF